MDRPNTPGGGAARAVAMLVEPRGMASFIRCSAARLRSSIRPIIPEMPHTDKVPQKHDLLTTVRPRPVFRALPSRRDKVIWRRFARFFELTMLKCDPSRFTVIPVALGSPLQRTKIAQQRRCELERARYSEDA
jgi:hypothetical protein